MPSTYNIFWNNEYVYDSDINTVYLLSSKNLSLLLPENSIFFFVVYILCFIPLLIIFFIFLN